MEKIALERKIAFDKGHFESPLKLDDNFAKFPVLDRTRSFEVLTALLFTRFAGGRLDKSVHGSRFSNPLIATHSSPGGGKSRFLDLIAANEWMTEEILERGVSEARKDSRLKSLSDETISRLKKEFKRMFEFDNFLPILVSYNGEQRVVADEVNSVDHNALFAIRLLHS